MGRTAATLSGNARTTTAPLSASIRKAAVPAATRRAGASRPRGSTSITGRHPRDRRPARRETRDANPLEPVCSGAVLRHGARAGAGRGSESPARKMIMPTRRSWSRTPRRQGNRLVRYCRAVSGSATPRLDDVLRQSDWGSSLQFGSGALIPSAIDVVWWNMMEPPGGSASVFSLFLATVKWPCLHPLHDPRQLPPASGRRRPVSNGPEDSPLRARSLSETGLGRGTDPPRRPSQTGRTQRSYCFTQDKCGSVRGALRAREEKRSAKSSRSRGGGRGSAQSIDSQISRGADVVARWVGR